MAPTATAGNIPRAVSAYEWGRNGEEPTLNINDIYAYRLTSPSGTSLDGISAKMEFIAETYPKYAASIIKKMFKVDVKRELIPEKASVRQDYVDGLKRFLQGECSYVADYFYSRVSQLLESSGLVAFIAGHRMLSPENISVKIGANKVTVDKKGKACVENVKEETEDKSKNKQEM